MVEEASPACPRCGAPAPVAFVAQDYNRRITAEPFRYHRCPACGIFFLDPVPANLGAYYARYHDIPAREVLLQRARAEQFKVDLLRKFTKGGRLLEVGPSYGAFLAAAQGAGFEPCAIEFDAECCRHLESVLGVRAIRADLPEAVVEELPPFDVLAMWHVVEHLPNPWRSLPALVRRLAPGGIAAISSPNPDSLQFRLFRARWMHLDAPRHLELIPRATLDAFLAGLGLEPVLATYTDEFTLGCNWMGWRESMSNLLSPDASRHVRRVYRRIGKIAAALTKPIEARGTNGTAYTVLYRKRPAA